MKRLMALALLLAFMLSLAACASKSDETTDTLESGNIEKTIPVMQNVVREIGRERLHTGVELSTDDAEAITEIIDNGTWIEATPNCVMNCSINLNGRLYYYSSDCGMLEELDLSKISYFSALVQEMNNKSLKLSDTQKDVLNAILEKYISLDFATAPIETQKLTLDDVVILSQQGDALTWSDFEGYQGQEIGSGLYIIRYSINELFEVWVGGVPDETPMYIYLRVNNKADDRIDIRTEDVPAFIAAHYDDLPKDWESAPDGGEPAQEEPDFSNSTDIPSDTQWIEGIGFIELAPGEEIKSPSQIIVDNDNSTIQFVITYSRSGLTLEYGLQSEDETEYSREIVGGTDVGAIEEIPSGIYFLYVRNSGDYSELPGYQDKTISFNATGAINYHLEDTQSIEN